MPAVSPSPRKTLFVVVFLSCAYFFGTQWVNVNARMDQTVAIVADGRLSIDPYVSNTWDWSEYDGRKYPNKPPGTSLLAVPVYALLYHGERLAGVNPLDKESPAWWGNAVIVNLVCNVFLCALAAVALSRALATLGCGEAVAIAGAAAWALATLQFPFATSYWAHSPVASMIAISLACVLAPDILSDRWRLPVAGFAAGFAVLSEYLALLALPGLALLAWSGRRQRRDLLAFAAGAVLPLMTLVVYQWACFGSPLATTYSYNNPGLILGEGGGMRGQVQAPAINALFQLTVGPFRGLFFFSPILLLAIPGVVALWREGRRGLAATCTLVPAAFIAVNSSWVFWSGGLTSGPRFLIPAIPVLMIAVARAMVVHPHTAWTLAFVSAANAFAIAAVHIAVPDAHASPLTSDIYPWLIAGTLHSENVGLRCGLPAHLSLVPPLALWAYGAYACRRALATPATPQSAPAP